MRSHRARFLSLGAAAIVTVALAAGCSSSTTTSSGSGSSANKSPILIGTSLSLTGDFSADGQAFQKGYTLWVHDVNAAGGLNGRKVQLVVLNDNSSPTQVTTNYQDLITVHHVNLTFGPFSSLLTAPAALVHQIVQGLVGRGYGEQDFAALIELEAQSSGLDLVSEEAEVSDGLGPPDSAGNSSGGENAGGDDAR